MLKIIRKGKNIMNDVFNAFGEAALTENKAALSFCKVKGGIYYRHANSVNLLTHGQTLLVKDEMDRRIMRDYCLVLAMADIKKEDGLSVRVDDKSGEISLRDFIDYERRKGKLNQEEQLKLRVMNTVRTAFPNGVRYLYSKSGYGFGLDPTEQKSESISVKQLTDAFRSPTSEDLQSLVDSSRFEILNYVSDDPYLPQFWIEDEDTPERELFDPVHQELVKVRKVSLPVCVGRSLDNTHWIKEKGINIKDFINNASTNLSGFKLYLSMDGIEAGDVKQILTRDAAPDKVTSWNSGTVPYFGVFNTLAQEQAEGIYNWSP